MSNQMSRRSLKWFQFRLEELVKFQAGKIDDKQLEAANKYINEQIEVLEYFIEQVKEELVYLDENKE